MADQDYPLDDCTAEDPKLYGCDWATSGLRLIENALKHYKKGFPFENDLFIFNPYEKETDDDYQEPYFEYKGSPEQESFSVSWYKHIGRGMNSSEDKMPDKWFEVVADCLLSLRD